MNIVKFLVLIAMMLSNPVFANIIASNEFMQIIDKEFSSKKNLELYYDERNRKAYKMLYNMSIDKQFHDLASNVFASTDKIYWRYMTLTTNEDYSKYGFQCVGLIKVASGIGPTANWSKGDIFGGTDGKTFPLKGSILATFYPGHDGKYNNLHTLIYYGKIDGHHYVIDSNWDLGKGYIQIHPITYKFKSSDQNSVSTEVNNLGTYFTIY